MTTPAELRRRVEALAPPARVHLVEMATDEELDRWYQHARTRTPDEPEAIRRAQDLLSRIAVERQKRRLRECL